MKRTPKAAYFDTSVLLKRYVREPETDRALVLMKHHIVVTATIAPLESMSALRRLEATGRLPAKSYVAILKRIQNDRQTWDLVSLSVEILQSAERILQEQHRAVSRCRSPCRCIRSTKQIEAASAFYHRRRTAKQRGFST